MNSCIVTFYDWKVISKALFLNQSLHDEFYQGIDGSLNLTALTFSRDAPFVNRKEQPLAA